MAKGQQQLQDEADASRRKAVDAKNRSDAAKRKAASDKLAKIPLTAEERAFVNEIAPKMNCGRNVDMPSPAAITRYSKLVGRMDVVAPTDDDE